MIAATQALTGPPNAASAASPTTVAVEAEGEG